MAWADWRRRGRWHNDALVALGASFADWRIERRRGR